MNIYAGKFVERENYGGDFGEKESVGEDLDFVQVSPISKGIPWPIVQLDANPLWCILSFLKYEFYFLFFTEAVS